MEILVLELSTNIREVSPARVSLAMSPSGTPSTRATATPAPAEAPDIWTRVMCDHVSRVTSWYLVLQNVGGVCLDAAGHPQVVHTHEPRPGEREIHQEDRK